MTTKQGSKLATQWPVYLAVGLLVVFGGIFVISFISASAPVPEEQAADVNLEEVVLALLENANPAQGDALINQYDCGACHRIGAANGIAPSFVGIAARAEDERPPLSAAAYLYESILEPQAHIVDGFLGSMPQNYRSRLTDEQIGHIIAYLLTPDAQ